MTALCNTLVLHHIYILFFRNTNMKTLYITTFLSSITLASLSHAQDAHHKHHSHHNHSEVQNTDPIGVMGAHLHEQGKWMTTYRRAGMKMHGNRTRTDSQTTAEVNAAGFPVSPIEMSTSMDMFGVMYGATNNLTLMAMGSYVEKEMNHVTGTGVSFKTRAKGAGDTKVSGLYGLYQGAHDRLHMQLGVSLPTGGIKQRDQTPAGADSKLPYPMQLGSGTYDPIVGVTYAMDGDGYVLGSQVNATIRTGEKNSQGYHLGNEYKATAWLAKPWTSAFSTSLRLEASAWEDIKGADAELNAALIPTARTDLRAGRRLDALVGVNYTPAKSHNLAAEFGLPVYERLDGPQLSTDYRFTLGYQLSF